MAKQIQSKIPYHLKVEIKSTSKQKVIKELKHILERAQSDKAGYECGDDGEGFESEIDFVEWKDS
jgi:hypothetical protein